PPPPPPPPSVWLCGWGISSRRLPLRRGGESQLSPARLSGCGLPRIGVWCARRYGGLSFKRFGVAPGRKSIGVG
ncbi:hypothetical protein, partial [Escherichia coli]|uniref:hypothetical protein n=1 Tax=Escherichia coli TaxID=562 RepID=UPI001BAFD3A6